MFWVNILLNKIITYDLVVVIKPIINWLFQQDVKTRTHIHFAHVANVTLQTITCLCILARQSLLPFPHHLPYTWKSFCICVSISMLRRTSHHLELKVKSFLTILIVIDSLLLLMMRHDHLHQNWGRSTLPGLPD